MDPVFLADENHRNAELSGSRNGALDFDCGGMIASHRIHCDFDVGHEELFLRCFDDFPVFVIAAVRAGAVRHAQLVAVRTLGEGSRTQMIVCPPPIPPGFGMSSFWIWHIMSSALPAGV
jgi:hypothetical protein